MKIKTIKQAESIVGGLEKTSKMPCLSYSIPASTCKVGMKMRKIKGSICSVCYACKGTFEWPVVQAAMQKRFDSLLNDRWVEAVTFLVKKQHKTGYFRFHSSGDLQGTWHLHKIVQVARNLPYIKFWLPTREYQVVSTYLKEYGELPENLTVRLSALMLDGIPPKEIAKKLGLTTSGASATNYNCPSSEQGGKCLNCRKCWDKTVENVNYKKH